MYIKRIFANTSATTQFLLLAFFLLIGATLSFTLTTGLMLFFPESSTRLMQEPSLLRIIQFSSAICAFLLPAIAMAWTCGNRPTEYLSLKWIKSGRVWLFMLGGLFLLSPTINLLGTFNQAITLPSFMAPIEEWMRAQEEAAAQLTTILLSNDHIETLIANLFVIAATAGLTEEFLFRGALQRVIGRCTNNPHIIIWMSAILFSAFHLQFYGFLPRMILGAYFGYLLYWSKSIWLPVFAHFTNNAIAVIGMSNSQLKDNEFISGEISQEHILVFSLLAILCLVLFFWLNKRLKSLL